MSRAPLHILHVVPYFYPAWAYGGIPRLAYGLSRALVELGHRITVITTDVFDARHRLPRGNQTPGGIQVITLPNLSNRLAYRHQAFLPLGLARAFDGLRHDPPDVLHLHGHRHLLNNAARRFALEHGVPYVFTPNGTLPAIERKLAVKQVFDRFLGGQVVADAHTIIAVSRAEVAQIRAAGVPASRIAMIPNGLDLAEFDPLPPPGTFKQAFDIPGRMVLYLGKLTPRKGVDHLIDAFAALDRPDVTLVIAGNDMGVGLELQSQVARLSAARPGAGERIRFVGLLTGEQRLAALADAEVLAYPSTLEIFGLVPFEGLLAGAPVVVGDDCGCGEIVQDARAGLLVRYGDVPGLTRAMLQLLDDPERRREMVARGRRFIRAHLGWERVAPATVEVYRSALRTAGR